MARPASDISERIVRAARDRFLLEGVEGASLRAIARDAGTNLGMVYYYYPSKDDLFLAVVEEVYAKLLDDLSRALPDPTLELRAKIERLYARFGAVSEDEMKVVRLIMREAIAGQSTRMGLLFQRFSRGHVAMLGAMLGTGMQRGEVRADLPPFALVMCTLFLGLFPQVMRRRLVEADVPVDVLLPAPGAFAEVLAAILFDGIAPAATARGIYGTEAGPEAEGESAQPALPARSPPKKRPPKKTGTKASARPRTRAK